MRAEHHHHHEHRPRTEPVVLEIGGELGALVVYTDRALLHDEIEISPAVDDDRRSHKDVLERFAGDRRLHAAVFDRLERGESTLWYRGSERARQTLRCAVSRKAGRERARS